MPSWLVASRTCLDLILIARLFLWHSWRACSSAVRVPCGHDALRTRRAQEPFRSLGIAAAALRCFGQCCIESGGRPPWLWPATSRDVCLAPSLVSRGLSCAAGHGLGVCSAGAASPAALVAPFRRLVLASFRLRRPRAVSCAAGHGVERVLSGRASQGLCAPFRQLAQ